jgi:hypothetical protein
VPFAKKERKIRGERKQLKATPNTLSVGMLQTGGKRAFVIANKKKKEEEEKRHDR